MGDVGNHPRLFLGLVQTKELRLNLYMKVLGLMGVAVFLTPWGRVSEMVDVSGYYISDGGLTGGYKVLKVDSSGLGEMYSYDDVRGALLSVHPFRYSSSLLKIDLDFNDGSHTRLTRGAWGMDGLWHCAGDTCRGMHSLVWISGSDLPEKFQRSLSKIKN